MIKENRIKKGYTQEQLSEIIGISPRHMQRIERDEYATTLNNIRKIIRILDIPDDEIIEFMKG